MNYQNKNVNNSINNNSNSKNSNQNDLKDYYSLYIKYKMKYLSLKKSNIKLTERIICNKMKYLNLKKHLGGSSFTEDLEAKSQISNKCEKYDYYPAKCDKDPDCDWDTRRICLPKDKSKSFTDVDGLIGSYLKLPNSEYKRLLNKISDDFDHLKTIKKGSNATLIFIKNIRKLIQKLENEISPEQLERYNIELNQRYNEYIDNKQIFLEEDIQKKIDNLNKKFKSNTAGYNDIIIKSIQKDITDLKNNFQSNYVEKYETELDLFKVRLINSDDNSNANLKKIR